MKKDSEILESIRMGNESPALSYLYDTTLKKVRQYIIKNGGDKENANDIFQDAVIIFINYVRNNKFNPKNNIDAFVYVVAKNLWVNQVRKDKRIVKYDNVNLYENNTDFNDQLSYLISKEKSSAVNKLFELLDEKCRKILHYYNHERLSMQEICEKMGYTSANAAKTTHYRCKQYLIKIISENKGLENLLKN